ncbi:hypothetical protein BGZ94_000852 [Podila epigama]|nr:hypothetical protein BGZ94_000852 [Podila epigama]
MPKVKSASTTKVIPVPAKAVAQKTKVEATPAPKKKMSAYNEFMKTELPKFRAANADVSHKEAFKQVALLWKSSSKNPKRTQ